MRYLIDFETKSDLSLTDVGVKRHLNTPSSDIVCMSWRTISTISDSPTKLWIPRLGYAPFQLNKSDRVYAFNVQFDRNVWNTIGGPKYNFPWLPIEQCIDVMALCGRYTYPQSLDFAGRVLNLSVQKDRRGKVLMKKIGLPPFEYTQSELVEFYNYCVRDTDTMYEMIKSLPKDELSPMEQRIWELTAKINATGLPIDTYYVNRIYDTTEHYKKSVAHLVPDLTGGEIEKVTQAIAIVEWAKSKGVSMPNLQAETVQMFIDRNDHPDVTALLKLRQKLGRTSTAKYKKLKEQAYAGRIYENLRYYGAATGRWGGLGFQVHNLPRATVSDVEAEIDKFRTTAILKKDPILSAKALIRAMIKAPKGKRIAAADYHAIENVLLLWVADEKKQLQVIRDGKEHYKAFAASVYNVAYEDVSPEQRFLGKVGILGAGYNAGAGGFLRFALSYGLDIDEDKADTIIKIYRQDHPNVRRLWYALRDCAIAAVEHKNKPFRTKGCTFLCTQDRNLQWWLSLTLPSGRALVYCSPEIRDDTFGPGVTHMGINSVTKQWARLKLIPGRITENIIQALARDVLAHAKINLDQAGYSIIASIHDEVLCEVNKGDGIRPMINIMTAMPEWCTDLPLTASGFVEKRYRKG